MACKGSTGWTRLIHDQPGTGGSLEGARQDNYGDCTIPLLLWSRVPGGRPDGSRGGGCLGPLNGTVGSEQGQRKPGPVHQAPDVRCHL